MKKWLAEDWEFTLTALEGEARHCRLGIEQGDRFVFVITQGVALG